MLKLYRSGADLFLQKKKKKKDRKSKVKRKPKSTNPLTAKRIIPTVADFNHDPMALTMCV